MCLLAAAVLVSSYQIYISRNGILEHAGVAHTLGILPARLRITSFLTYSFVHSDISHLLINMFFLWVFGAGVESALGRWRMLAVYITGGCVGGALQVLVALRAPGLLNPNTPIIGASAGCACLIGVYAVRFYRDRITFVGLPYRPTVVEVVTLFLCVEAGIGIWQVFVGMPAGGVAHWAHIGGFVFGLSCAFLMHVDREGQAAYLSEDALAALDRSQPGAAIGRLEQLAARDPQNASTFADLARSWLAFRDPDQASVKYIAAIRLLVEQNRRKDAAHLYCEMRDSLPDRVADISAPPPQWTSVLTPALTAPELFAVGLGLEEIDAIDRAAEALRAVAVRDPASPEAETALLKVAGHYIKRLGRAEEAGILLRLFIERYPNSALSVQADDLMRAAGTADRAAPPVLEKDKADADTA